MSIKQGHRAKFKRITRELSELMEDVREYNEEAWLYAESSGVIHLMEGQADPRETASKRQEHIEETSVFIPSLDVGAW